MSTREAILCPECNATAMCSVCEKTVYEPKLPITEQDIRIDSEWINNRQGYEVRRDYIDLPGRDGVPDQTLRLPIRKDTPETVRILFAWLRELGVVQ